MRMNRKRAEKLRSGHTVWHCETALEKGLLSAVVKQESLRGKRIIVSRDPLNGKRSTQTLSMIGWKSMFKVRRTDLGSITYTTAKEAYRLANAINNRTYHPLIQPMLAVLGEKSPLPYGAVQSIHQLPDRVICITRSKNGN